MKNTYPNLQEKMEDFGFSARELAAIAGIGVLKTRLKLMGILPWKLTEVVRICGFFSVTDAESLFVQFDTN